MIPLWLHVLSIFAVAAGFACAFVITADVCLHPQHMWIMNIVWPVVALFAGPIALWGYFSYGRLAMHEIAMLAMEKGEESPSKRLTPFPIMVGNGTAHCGAGCTLGDIVSEWLVFAVPAIAVVFGYDSIFPDKMFAVWIVDYIFAYSFGIVFQYFTIAPMRGLGLRDGVLAAIKADTLSLTAWQLGMYGFMALAQFYIFRMLLGARLEVDSFEFWFMMQIGMLCGFVTSYPVNWWLIQTGIKERM